MKRFSKILSLIGCSVFLLGGGYFTSCSDDDDDGPAPVAVTGVSLSDADGNESSSKLVSENTQEITLTATVTPENASNKEVTWESSDPDVATLTSATGTSNTVTIPANATGSATITVTTADGDHTATYDITVSSEGENQGSGDGDQGGNGGGNQGGAGGNEGGTGDGDGDQGGNEGGDGGSEQSGTYTQTATIALTNGAQFGWSGIPVRPSDKNVSAEITRATNSYTGYLGRRFWLVDGVFAEFSSSGLGYTNSATDATHSSQVFLPAVQSEKIKGPFKLTVTTGTNKADRTFKIFAAATEADLWTGEPKKSEALNANSGVHTYEYDGEDELYVGFGTLPSEADNTVYTVVTQIKLESNTVIPQDTWEATSIAFTNAGISDEENPVLTLTKDAIGTTGYALTVRVAPDYATDKTYSISYTSTAGTPLVKVSEGGVITVDSSLSENETGTLVATANGGENVTAMLTLVVKGIASDADKVAQTVTELQEALAAAGATFTYGTTRTVVANAQAFLQTVTFTYPISVVPTVNDTTGELTFTVTSGTAEERVTVPYSEADARLAVQDAVAKIKEASAAVWTTDAATTKTTVQNAITALNLADVTTVVEEKLTEDNGTAVAVKVTSAFFEDESDDSILYEAPRFTVANGVLSLLAKTYTYQFDYDSLKADTGDDAWSATTASEKTGRSGVTQFTTSFKGTDLKSSSSITLKFKNVGSYDLYVFSSNKNRTFKIGDKTYITATDTAALANSDGAIYATKASGAEFVYSLDVADPTAVTTLTITGGSQSVYPLGIILYAMDGEATSLNVEVDVPDSDNDVVISSATAANTYTVTGASLDGATAIAWYIDDKVVADATESTLTLPATSKAGTFYELRVEVTGADGHQYSDSTTVLYK